MRGFKKAIKYAAAIATAGAMVGAGILAGMAYNLGDLPKPFVNDKGQFDAYVVVGEKAATSDVVGAITVGAAFAQKAVTPHEAASGVYTGAKVINADLDSNVSTTSSTMGSWILTGLADNVDLGNDFGDGAAYSEKVITNANWSAVKTYALDNDLNDTAMLFAKNGTIEYKIEFNNNFNSSLVSVNNPLNIKILGEQYKIINITSNKIILRAATEHMMSTGQSLVVDGHNVSVSMVSDTKAVFVVDGKQAIISTDDGAKTVNGLQIQVLDIFNNGQQNLVDFLAGKYINKTVENGMKFNDNDNFVWDINFNTGKYIGVKLNTDFNLTAGNEFDFPNKYIGIKYDGLNDIKYGQFTIYNDKNDLLCVTAPTSTYDVEVSAGGTTYDLSSVCFNVTSTNITAEINGQTMNVSALPSNGTSVSFAKLMYGNTEYDLEMYNTSSGAHYSVELLNTASSNDEFILSNGTTAANALKLDNNYLAYGSNNLTDVEGTKLFTYGEKVENIKKNWDDKKFVIDVPSEQAKAKVVVLGPESKMISGTAGVDVNPIDVNMAQLDSAMGTVDKPVVLVGGPAVNKLVAQLADANKTMSANDWRTGNMTDKAIIQYVEDAFGSNPALIIAGYDAKDTVLASKVVASQLLHDQYANEFKGKDKVVIYSKSGEMDDITFE